MDSVKEDMAAAQPPSYDAQNAAFRTTFASVSLHMTDRIRFTQFPPDDIAKIRATIQYFWPRGIQAERRYSVSYEFKLRGVPWYGSGTGPDAVPSQILMREIFSRLYSLGWIMTASTDISRKGHDNDTLIFRKQPVPPPAASWAAISFKQGDKLRFLGAPPDLISSMSQLFRSTRMLQSESAKTTAANYHEFKLNGTPWYASGEDTMATRLLILKMVETMEMNGWSLYASIDQNTGPPSNSNSSSSETDVWYCVKSADWTPGSIILHR
jgi:hypothetical protein